MGDPKPGSAALKVLFRHLAAPKNSQNFLNLLIPCLGPLPKGNFSVQNPKNPACGSSQWETPLGAFSAPKSHPWNSIPSRPTQGQRENPPAKVGTVLRRSGAAPKRSWYFRKCWGISDIFAEHPWLCTGMHSFLSLVFPVFFMDFFP